MTPGTAPTEAFPERARGGTWRAVGRGWPVFVAGVVGNAAVQALLVFGDPVVEPGLGFAALVAASAASVVLTVAAVAIAALAAVDGRPLTGAGAWRRLAPVAGWTTALGLLAAVGSVLVVWLGPLLLLAGPLLLPAVAAGSAHPTAAAVRAVRGSPGRTVIAVLAYLLLVAISWLIALLLGFLVTGPLAAAITWLWFGGAAVGVLCMWSSVFRRGSVART